MTAASGKWTGARNQLLIFFVLTYAITIASALVSKYFPGLPAAIWWIPQVFSPTIVAVLMTWVIDGPDTVKKLLLRLVQWKVRGRWYIAAFALFWIPLLIALGYMALGYPSRGLAPGMTPWLLAYSALYNVYAGPLSEETGWRGYALPRLQQRFSALTSTVILGVVWACWHLPFYAVSGGGVGIPFPAYVALVVTNAIYITWIYNNTGGSLLLCVIAHFSFNAASAFLPGHLGLLPQMVFNIGCGGGLVGIVAAIVWYFGPAHLSRTAERQRLAA